MKTKWIVLVVLNVLNCVAASQLGGAAIVIASCALVLSIASWAIDRYITDGIGGGE